jgi:predicted phosphodiesterase
MTILLVGDIHLADKPPSIRTDSYTDDILAKLEAAVRMAQEASAECIVLAGDVFHIKTPTRNSHALVQRTGEALTAAGIPVFIVPGNHDLSNDRLESLSKQPLGTLAKMEGIELLIGGNSDYRIFGLPYLHDWSADLPVWMSRYKKWADQCKAGDFDFYPLMVTHAPIFPPGEEPPYEFIGADDWARLMVNGDCLYGHIHDPHGVYKPNPEVGVTMCNNGAISRGSLHEKTLKREPKVTLWHGTPGAFEALPLPFRPASAVFKLGEKEDVDEKTSRVEEFLESIGSTKLDGLSIEEVAHHAQARGLNPRTLSLINELLEQV